MSRAAWQKQAPADGFKVGDYVGLVYSDHQEYIFDNPEGIVTKVHKDAEDYDGHATVTVQVEAVIGSDRVYLIERKP